MIHLRVVSPPDITGALMPVLRSEPGVLNLTMLREVVSHVGGQKELERVSGVDQTTISAWLKRVKNPKYQTVKKIADATGFYAEWLYLGSGPKRSEDPSAPAADNPALNLELLTQLIEHVESPLQLLRALRPG